MHIHLPNLGKDKAAFQAIADKFNVQIRGAHGEHTETDDHIYDISNRRRLGFSEASLVQDMYNGVAAMIDAELKLCGKDKAEPEAVFKYLEGLKIIAGKTMEDKLSAEDMDAILKKIEEVEILDASKLTADLTKEEDGSCSVQVLCQALAKHWWAAMLLKEKSNENLQYGWLRHTLSPNTITQRTLREEVSANSNVNNTL